MGSRHMIDVQHLSSLGEYRLKAQWRSAPPCRNGQIKHKQAEKTKRWKEYGEQIFSFTTSDVENSTVSMHNSWEFPTNLNLLTSGNLSPWNSAEYK